MRPAGAQIRRVGEHRSQLAQALSLVVGPLHHGLSAIVMQLGPEIDVYVGPGIVTLGTGIIVQLGTVIIAITVQFVHHRSSFRRLVECAPLRSG